MEGVFPGIEQYNPLRGLCFCMSTFLFSGRALDSERREPCSEHFFALIVVWVLVRFYRCVCMAFYCSTVNTKARTRSLKGIRPLRKHLSFVRLGPCLELRLPSIIFCSICIGFRIIRAKRVSNSHLGYTAI